ncbi:MAG: ZIP family metal transporter [Candidatus Peregrinibacteria bacterium]|nr:ZIP family metal transporter [Candidatus Peregrinibacteria bacterium]MDZ4244899.1 ZIP family metal transporter [Candidatus Gracilibacteria bacterium]
METISLLSTELPSSNIWLYSIVSVSIVSLISLVGLFTLSIKVKHLQRVLMFFVSFAAGALLGDAFLHLIPEASAEFGFGLSTSISILAGIVIFFVIERFIHFQHCHHIEEIQNCDSSHHEPHVHVFAKMNLIGDSVHNFIDGMVIAASFIVSKEVGIATTLAVVLHEIPQEIGDFAVLIHGGFTRTRALVMNFITALFAVLGAVLTLVLSERIGGVEEYLVPIAAGGFIYIACSDLIPELHKESSRVKLVGQFVMFLVGIGVMWLLLGQ